MATLSKRDRTPSEVLFDTMKRRGGIPHRELASLILSSHPLNDGRSPLDHAKDRSWLSHVIVHAPIGAQQERYFLDYGMAATRVMGRLKPRHKEHMDPEEVLALLQGDCASEMEHALDLCHQNPELYRNSLARIANQEDLSVNERAKLALVLFLAAGCSASSLRAVEYVHDYALSSSGGGTNTPETAAVPESVGEAVAPEQTLGLVRVEDGHVMGSIHWLSPDGRDLTIGALAVGDDDVTDVDVDVSAQHARIWHDDKRGWLVEDLGSTNGSRLTDALTGQTHELDRDEPEGIGPGDELTLGANTTFVVIEGQA